MRFLFEFADPARSYSHLLPYQPGRSSWKSERSSHVIDYVFLRRLASPEPVAQLGQRVTRKRE